ncbi:proline-rich protein 23A3-like [Meriones unguiculatus]|uniref:proline-rich protein 23A3-like n=1 Tax=Meriones unguiculatus TaxID=10047 RepID=UPI00293F248A|nr:proline-rich protein 23A3-like [Meriones unguiculatus]
MLRVRPRSPSADAAPCWAPQPPGPGPAKRPRLHEPARPEPLLQPDQEAPARPHDDALTSVVFLAAGSALQLPLDGVDLLLEPEPTSVLEVTFQGHTIILVPEGLQTSAQLGQPGFSPSSPQEAALQDLPQDHLVVLQPGPLCEYVLDISYQEDSWEEEEEEDFLELWMDPSTGQTTGLLSSTRVYSPWPQDPGAEPWPLVPSTSAEACSPRSAWDLDTYLQGPFPSSPLRPLPPSPPPSPQEQRPPCPPRTPCKARRRLFCE